jgi:hypothetical protein
MRSMASANVVCIMSPASAQHRVKALDGGDTTICKAGCAVEHP